MRDGDDGDDGNVIAFGSELADRLEAVFVLALLRVGPGIMDIDAGTELLQLPHDIHHLRVADVGAVLLEGDSEDQGSRIIPSSDGKLSLAADVRILRQVALLVDEFFAAR